MLVFVLNQAQKANTGKIQTPVYKNVREFGIRAFSYSNKTMNGLLNLPKCFAKKCAYV